MQKNQFYHELAYGAVLYFIAIAILFFCNYAMFIFPDRIRLFNFVMMFFLFLPFLCSSGFSLSIFLCFFIPFFFFPIIIFLLFRRPIFEGCLNKLHPDYVSWLASVIQFDARKYNPIVSVFVAVYLVVVPSVLSSLLQFLRNCFFLGSRRKRDSICWAFNSGLQIKFLKAATSEFFKGIEGSMSLSLASTWRWLFCWFYPVPAGFVSFIVLICWKKQIADYQYNALAESIMIWVISSIVIFYFEVAREQYWLRRHYKDSFYLPPPMKRFFEKDYYTYFSLKSTRLQWLFFLVITGCVGFLVSLEKVIGHV